MRVTVLTARFPPMHGGVAAYTLAWCRALRESAGELACFDLTVVTSPDASSHGSTADALDAIAVDVGQADWGIGGARALRSAVERSKPDVVVAQYAPHAFSRMGGGLPTALTIRSVTRSLDVPLVVNAHELYSAWSEAWRRAPWCLSQRMAIGVLAASSHTFVVTVTARQERVQTALPWWRDRIVVIPNGPTVLPAAPHPRWREERAVDDDVVVLATMGLGHPTQDTAALEATLDHLQSSGIKARLFVAGGMTVRHPWASHLGYLDDQAAAHLLAATDLFVLPLTDGASGRRSSLISALAAGAPIVTTTGSDTDPALFSPNSLCLTPAGDTPAFAAAVARLATDPSARETLREAGRTLFDREFAWPVIARRWAGILDAATA